LILYRLNQVPEKNFIKFLDLLGVTLSPANPATTDLTFGLTSPLDFPIKIRRGTEIATRRTEAEDAIVFTTDQELIIAPPILRHILVTHDVEETGILKDQLATSRTGGSGHREESTRWELGERGLALFQGVPRPGDTFYLGYSPNTPIKNSVIALSMSFVDQSAADLEQAGVAITPSNPPLRWEYWDGARQGWVMFDSNEDSDAWLENDGTMGLTRSDQVVFHVPGTAAVTSLAEEDEREAYWIRCVNMSFSMERGAYLYSPRLRSGLTEAIGGTVKASNAYQVVGEVLGISSGKPGQSMKLSHLPVLPLRSGETVQVGSEGDWENWEQKDNFSNSGPDDNHFVCDLVSGEINFGPVIRSPRGEEIRYGSTPPQGRPVRLTSYRYGGGPAGNVGRNTITVPKSKMPYVGSVTNRRAASGGSDPESVDQAKIRGPQVVRNLQRAVTPQDFEALAKAASTSVGRAHCVRIKNPDPDGGRAASLDTSSMASRVLPGVVHVLIVPALAQIGPSTLTPRQLRDQLDPSNEVLSQVRGYLEERRLITTLLIVGRPDYVWVSIYARVKVSPGVEHSRVKEEIEKKLHRFVHPLWGGYQGDGWSFGRSLYLSEIYSQVQSVPGVEYTEAVEAFVVDPDNETRVRVTAPGPGTDGSSPTGSTESKYSRGGPPESPQAVLLPPSGVLCPWYHNVTCF